LLINSNEYLQIIGEIKSRIRKARRQAVLAANYELITLNWYIGKTINGHSAWGNKFIENLAGDIKLEFPNAKGYSVRNLKYMAKFARVYPDFEIVQTVSAQLSWSHNTALLDKVKDSGQRLWYARKAIEDGWSLNTLEYQIETCLYERQTKLEKTTIFLPQRHTTAHKGFSPPSSLLSFVRLLRLCGQFLALFISPILMSVCPIRKANLPGKY
jgi:predicted nuclease of restriction endonuclease-like (RecB) superfamily